MSRCVCCNKNLSDFEATRFDEVNKVYVDMCNDCYDSSGVDSLIEARVRHDLSTTDDEDE